MELIASKVEVKISWRFTYSPTVLIFGVVLITSVFTFPRLQDVLR
jgi:hypothetical protein